MNKLQKLQEELGELYEQLEVQPPQQPPQGQALKLFLDNIQDALDPLARPGSPLFINNLHPLKIHLSALYNELTTSPRDDGACVNGAITNVLPQVNRYALTQLQKTHLRTLRRELDNLQPGQPIQQADRIQIADAVNQLTSNLDFAQNHILGPHLATLHTELTRQPAIDPPALDRAVQVAQYVVRHFTPPLAPVLLQGVPQPTLTHPQRLKLRQLQQALIEGRDGESFENLRKLLGAPRDGGAPRAGRGGIDPNHALYQALSSLYTDWDQLIHPTPPIDAQTQTTRQTQVNAGKTTVEGLIRHFLAPIPQPPLTDTESKALHHKFEVFKDAFNLVFRDLSNVSGANQQNLHDALDSLLNLPPDPILSSTHFLRPSLQSLYDSLHAVLVLAQPPAPLDFNANANQALKNNFLKVQKEVQELRNSTNYIVTDSTALGKKDVDINKVKNKGWGRYRTMAMHWEGVAARAFYSESREGELDKAIAATNKMLDQLQAAEGRLLVKQDQLNQPAPPLNDQDRKEKAQIREQLEVIAETRKILMRTLWNSTPTKGRTIDRIISFSDKHKVMLFPYTQRQIDAQVAAWLNPQGNVGVAVIASVGDLKTSALFHEGVRINHNVLQVDANTQVNVVSVQGVRDHGYESILNYNSQDLTLLQPKDYVKWIVRAVEDHLAGAEDPDSPLEISGKWPDLLMKYMVVYCQKNDIELVNKIDPTYKPSKDKVKEFEDLLEQNRVDIYSKSTPKTSVEGLEGLGFNKTRIEADKEETQTQGQHLSGHTLRR